ncbi:hypothetical protein [Gudongella sp. DL1XJH-153]|uniref:hypothetical protein n=1 Tax=Gudongella sp. DL1XJH-153 TaxID=3409804 RepID=UPI003BB77848
MLKTFNDYLSETPRFKNICDTPEFKFIYESILCEENMIIKMVEAAEHSISPVSIPARDIETYIDSINNQAVTLDRTINEKVADLNRQAIGTMVAHILNQFGYEKKKGQNRPIPIDYKGKHLSTGATYDKTGSASMQVIKRIAEV